MNEEASEALGRITPGEWARLIKVLTKYARNRSGELGWRTESSDELPGGETPESVVSKAIKMVLRGARETAAGEDGGVKAGVRRWDPRKDPDLKKYLMDVIKSVLNHLAEGEENRIFRRTPDGPEARRWEGRLKRPPADRGWLARSGASPEELLLEEEESRLRERAIEMLVEEAGDDPILSRVIKSMLAGNRDAAHISEDTGLSAKQIYNATKRLDRKGQVVRKKLRQPQNPPSLRRSGDEEAI